MLRYIIIHFFPSEINMFHFCLQIYLLPDKTKSGKRKTKVKKHTLNPIFDEVLRFYMSLSSLESRTLWLTVWHSDMFVSFHPFLISIYRAIK